MAYSKELHSAIFGMPKVVHKPITPLIEMARHWGICSRDHIANGQGRGTATGNTKTELTNTRAQTLLLRYTSNLSSFRPRTTPMDARISKSIQMDGMTERQDVSACKLTMTAVGYFSCCGTILEPAFVFNHKEYLNETTLHSDAIGGVFYD
jgi:hypothetical protein